MSLSLVLKLRKEHHHRYTRYASISYMADPDAYVPRIHIQLYAGATTPAYTINRQCNINRGFYSVY